MFTHAVGLVGDEHIGFIFRAHGYGNELSVLFACVVDLAAVEIRRNYRSCTDGPAFIGAYLLCGAVGVFDIQQGDYFGVPVGLSCFCGVMLQYFAVVPAGSGYYVQVILCICCQQIGYVVFLILMAQAVNRPARGENGISYPLIVQKGSIDAFGGHVQFCGFCIGFWLKAFFEHRANVAFFGKIRLYPSLFFNAFQSNHLLFGNVQLYFLSLCG